MFGLKKKKYLEYYFSDDDLNSPEVANEVIGEFISPATPKTSCWWSKLKTRIDEHKNQFEYVKQQHKFGNTDIVESSATAKTCPAINNILMNSYLIKSPSDMIITINKDCGFLYNSSNDKISISTHPTCQFHTEKNGLFDGKMNLKLALPINIKTDNIPWIFVQPMYHNDMWFDVTPGVIDGKYTKGQPLNINVLVDIPEGEPVTYEIKAGDVLAYMWLPEKVELKHTQSKFITPLLKRKWSSKSRFN
mgnify:FL=1